MVFASNTSNPYASAWLGWHFSNYSEREIHNQWNPHGAGGVIVAHIVLAIATGIVGVFFLASGVQTPTIYGNLFGQSCMNGYGLCIHPEWIATAPDSSPAQWSCSLFLKEPSQT